MEVPQISGKMWHWEKDVHTKSDASLQKDYRKFFKIIPIGMVLRYHLQISLLILSKFK